MIKKKISGEAVYRKWRIIVSTGDPFQKYANYEIKWSGVKLLNKNWRKKIPISFIALYKIRPSGVDLTPFEIANDRS